MASPLYSWNTFVFHKQKRRPPSKAAVAESTDEQRRKKSVQEVSPTSVSLLLRRNSWNPTVFLLHHNYTYGSGASWIKSLRQTSGVLIECDRLLRAKLSFIQLDLKQRDQISLHLFLRRFSTHPSVMKQWNLDITNLYIRKSLV